MTGRLLQLDGGTSIGITALGDPAARHTVLFCHPTPGASGFDPDPLTTRARSVRLVGADRPGFGASGPAAPRGVAPHLAELALLDELAGRGNRVDALVGWGYGGLVALRVAAERPGAVGRVVLVQTPRPGSRLYEIMGRRSRAWMLQHHDPVLARAAAFGGTRIRPLSLLGAGTRDEALALPGLRERCERMLDEGARQGEAGLAFDRAGWRRHDWSRLARGIRARVLVMYGARDRLLGAPDVKWFARHLRYVDVESIDEAGPLAIASEWGHVLDFALS